MTLSSPAIAGQAPPGAAPPDRPLRAAAWMMGALSCFSVMAIAGREVSAHLDTFELMTYRSVIGVAIVVGLLAATGRLGTVRARRMKLHAARNVAHFAGQNLWFHAVTLIPLAQLFAYEFTNPLWVALLAPLILGERMTRTRLLAAGLGFAGILIVARPGLAAFGEGQVAALAAAVGFAGSVIFTKMLSRTESTPSILFWMTVTQTLFGLVCAGWDGDMTLPDSQSWPWVALVALCGLTAHYCVTSALSCAPASVVAPMEFLRLPMIAAAGMLLYGEALEPAVFVGAAVVLTANLINIRAERRRARPEGNPGAAAAPTGSDRR